MFVVASELPRSSSNTHSLYHSEALSWANYGRIFALHYGRLSKIQAFRSQPFCHWRSVLAQPFLFSASFTMRSSTHGRTPDSIALSRSMPSAKAETKVVRVSPVLKFGNFGRRALLKTSWR